MSGLTRLLRALFAWNHGPGVELVALGNVLTSLAVGVAGWHWWELSLRGGLLVSGVSFCALSLALLHRLTLWLPLSLGALFVSLAPTLLLAGLGARLLGGAGAWLGGGLGLLLGVWVTASSYVELFRSVAGRR